MEYTEARVKKFLRDHGVIRVDEQRRLTQVVKLYLEWEAEREVKKFDLAPVVKATRTFCVDCGCSLLTSNVATKDHCEPCWYKH